MTDTIRTLRYKLPLIRKLTTGCEPFREGLILTAMSPNGFPVYGEIAPLPRLHFETLDDCILQLNIHVQSVAVSDIDRILDEDLYPSVRCGLEMLQRQLVRSEVKVGQVPINVLLQSAPSGRELAEQVERLVDEGNTCFKLKVGRQELQHDIEAVNLVCELLKDNMTLRLDANQAWSLGDALAFAAGIDASRIEYIEEPVNDLASLPAFIESTDLPVALDESLAIPDFNLADWAGMIDAVILKPMVLGGFRAPTSWWQEATEKGLKVTLTSCFESGLFLRELAVFADELGLGGVAHGLDTWRWFEEDTIIPATRTIEGQIGFGGPIQLNREVFLDG